MKVYLDNSATTQIDQRVLKLMNKFHLKYYGNASSIHYLGDISSKAIADAKKIIAKILNCSPENLFFTSGATESNNLIIKGVMRANKDKGNHLIVSEIEHSSVLHPAKELEKEGFSVTYLKVNKDGLVDPQELEKFITNKTVLVSVMTVNNEIGTIQDIKKLCEIAHKKGAYFHTDAVQAIPYEIIDINGNNIDFLSLSAHKFHGPKGVGLAYLNTKIKIEPQVTGGGQAQGIRAGTYNTPGIIGMAEALRLIYKEREVHIKNVKELRDMLLTGIQKEISGTHINGSMASRTPNNLNIRFDKIEGEAILMDLSTQGICVSTGSACSSKSLRVSHVLKALGIDKNELNSSIRFTLGKFNQKKEITYTIKALKKAVDRLRAFTALK